MCMQLSLEARIGHSRLSLLARGNVASLPSSAYISRHLGHPARSSAMSPRHLRALHGQRETAGVVHTEIGQYVAGHLHDL